MKKLLFIITLCFSFAVSAETIMPNGLIYAAPVEQAEKSCSVIVKNDATETMAINPLNINSPLKDATLKKDRSLSYRFISSDILTVKKVLHSDLSPLKPDKLRTF